MGTDRGVLDRGVSSCVCVYARACVCVRAYVLPYGETGVIRENLPVTTNHRT